MPLPLSPFKIAAMKWKRNFVFILFGMSVITLFSSVSFLSLWTNNIAVDYLFAAETKIQAVDPQMGGIMTQTQKQWSDVKLAIYMTTHLPEEHLKYLPCWHDAIQRMDIFKYADLILYTSSQPTSAQLAQLPFRNTIIKRYSNTLRQQGAIQAMIDPFVNNATWFDEYDWVIRLNPDVLIRHDTWLIQTMMNPSFDGIFHECCNIQNYSYTNPKLHSDFYAFRPNAVNRDLVLKSNNPNAEYHVTHALRNIYDSGRFAFVEGASNARACICRIQGVGSPVIHNHDLWRKCPNYYSATRNGVY
jgi:hypothetical protein